MDEDLHSVTGEFARRHSDMLNTGLPGSGGHRVSQEIDDKKIPSGGAVVREKSEKYKEGALNNQRSSLGNIQLYGLFIRSGGLLDICRFSISPYLLLDGASRASAGTSGPRD